jgi:hypothetical protein
MTGMNTKVQREIYTWLAPMLEAAENRPDIDIGRLMSQAAMPAAEAASPFLDSLAKAAPIDRVVGIDWIRFGELLRHELGWHETHPAYQHTG